MAQAPGTPGQGGSMSSALTENAASKASIPISNGVTTSLTSEKRSKKANVASLPATAIKTEQPDITAVKEEGGPESILQVETSGLATAVALTGSKKRARPNKAAPASSVGNAPVTPEPEKTASQALRAQPNQDARDALASALRMAVAARGNAATAAGRPTMGKKQQDAAAAATGGTEAAVGGMPPIPAAAESVKLRKRIKSAAAAAAAAAAEPPAAADAPAPAKLRKRAKSAAIAALSVDEAAIAPAKSRGRAKVKVETGLAEATTQEPVEEQVSSRRPLNGSMSCWGVRGIFEHSHYT